MEVRQDYRQTEVGIVPKDWQISRFGDLCSVLRGGSPRPIQNYITDGPDGINWIKIGDVSVGAKYIDATAEKIIPAGALRSRRVKAGDFLLSNSMSFGRPYILRTDGCIHDGWLVIQGYQSAFDTEYLYYYLSAAAVLAQYTRYAAGSSVLNLNKEVVSNISVAVPPFPEQHAIAAALSDVDALLGELDRLIAKKSALKQAVMQQLLTGQTRLPGFNDEWQMTRLGDHVAFLRHGVNSRAELLPEGKVKYLHYGDVHASQDAYLTPDSLPCLPVAKASTLDRLRDGDLILADASEDVAGVSKSVEIRGVGDQEVVSGLHTIAARFDKNVLADGFKGFLQFCPPFATPLRRLAAGTKVYATNRAHVASVEMPLPSVPEQIAIAAVLTDMDVELAALKARRDKTRDLKQGMMQELLTGNIRLI